jgi:hypothetical protein
MSAIAADELPANTGGIATGIRVNQKASDGEPPDSRKKILPGWSAGKDARSAITLPV